MTELEIRASWEALGQYIQRNLKQKKAVNVPRLGTFTFTSPPVSFDGLTNARTREDRVPVFICANELAPNLRAGIYHGTGVRPYTVKGFGGKVPTVRLNYTDVAQLARGNKDAV